MIPHEVRQTIRIGAPASVVFDELLAANSVAEWIDGVLVEADEGVTYTFITTSGDLVRARVDERLAARRLVLSWTQPDDPRLPHGSTVEMTLTPHGGETVLDLHHHANQPHEPRRPPMTETNSCEWCGRAGEQIELDVRAVDDAIHFALPVLCPVCAALLGTRQPLGQGTTPAWIGLLDADPGPGPNAPVSSPEHAAWRDEQDLAFTHAARRKVFTLLTENHRRKAEPVPTWLSPAH